MSTRVTTIETSMASGELDPNLRGQRDLDAYKNGLKKARNVIIKASGGVERRPGTRDVNGLYGTTRLEAFEFSADQRYLVAFTAARVDIFDMAGTHLIQIGAPDAAWDATSLWEMSTTQLGDVMIIAHPTFAPRVLTRTSLTTFTLPPLVFEQSADGRLVYQPYYKFEAPEITLTPSADVGAITLTAKDGAGAAFGLWTADHVGQRIRIYDAEVVITSLVSSSVANASVQAVKLKGKLDLDPFKTTKGSSVVETLHLFHGLSSGVTVTISGANDTGSIPASYFNNGHTVTVLDEHRYQFTLAGVSYNFWEDPDGDGTPTSNAYTAARLSEDGGGPNVEFSVAGTPTRAWMEPSINAVAGYPGACCFHEGRLWLAGTDSQPDAVWGSSALQPLRFDAGKGYDGDSVQVAIGTEDVSRVRHVVSNGELVCMTANSESAFIVRDGEPVTPSNARIKGQSNAGCSATQPAVYDGAIIFAQENGKGVYEMSWSESERRFASVMISTLASHLISNPTSIDSSPSPAGLSEAMCFAVNDIGSIAVFRSDRRENVAGWTRWDIGDGIAIVESIACVGPNVFMAVSERGLHRLYKLDTALCLDGAWSSTSVTRKTGWTAPAQYRSDFYDVVVDTGAGIQWVGKMFIPANGIITTPLAYTVQIGDGFLPVVETLPPSIGFASGPRDGMIKRTVRTIADFGDDSVYVQVSNYPVPATPAAFSPVSGPQEVWHLGCERDPTVTYTQSAPVAPWRMLSVVQEVAI